MAHGWFNNLTQADDYFQTERYDSTLWDDNEESGDQPQIRSLIHAYNRLYYDPRWNLPTLAMATAAQLVILRKAQAEMAYYLKGHLRDEDRRKNLQAQGVIKAGIVKEEYLKEMLKEVPIPAIVIALLKPWLVSHLFRTFDFDRDEDAT